MRLKYLIPLIVFLLLAGFLFKGLYLDPRRVPSALIDKPAPEFNLPVLQAPERSVSKKDLLGKVYLLNVWASWCEACRYEHPFYVDAKRAGEKVFIVGYNYRDKRYARCSGCRRWGIRTTFPSRIRTAKPPLTSGFTGRRKRSSLIRRA